MLARVLSAVGRTMITVGILLLLFVAYQLWGTGIRTAQAQDRLERDFADRLAEAAELAASTTTSTSTSTSTTTPTTLDPSIPTTTIRLEPSTVPPLAPELLPERGGVAGQIVIPAIGVDKLFVQGVSVDDLKLGPGHYPESPLPGQAGNAAIAGHRTTYGAPFGDLDRLQPGDEIDVTTVQGTFTYLVRETVVVSPSQVEVLDADHWGWANALTLTACHPKYSARQRIVVAAELVGDPAPPTPPPPTTEPGSVDPSDDVVADDGPTAFEGDGAGLSGHRASAWPAVWWAVVCAVLWIGAWLVGRWRRGLKWPAYGVGLLPFGVALFFFFEEFSRLLPANY